MISIARQHSPLQTLTSQHPTQWPERTGSAAKKNLGANLRRAKTLMRQPFLHGEDIHAPLQQMRSKTVTDSMATRPLLNPCTKDRLFPHPLNRLFANIVAPLDILSLSFEHIPTKTDQRIQRLVLAAGQHPRLHRKLYNQLQCCDLYRFRKKPDVDVYAFGSTGIYRYDYYLSDEPGFGPDAAARLKYDLSEALDNPPPTVSGEIGFRLVAFDYYSYSAIGLDAGIRQ